MTVCCRCRAARMRPVIMHVPPHQEPKRADCTMVTKYDFLSVLMPCTWLTRPYTLRDAVQVAYSHFSCHLPVCFNIITASLPACSCTGRSPFATPIAWSQRHQLATAKTIRISCIPSPYLETLPVSLRKLYKRSIPIGFLRRREGVRAAVRTGADTWFRLDLDHEL